MELYTSHIHVTIKYSRKTAKDIMNTTDTDPHRKEYAFEQLTEQDLSDVDNPAILMSDVDKNCEKLVLLWNTKKQYRIINSPLVGDWDNFI